MTQIVAVTGIFILLAMNAIVYGSPEDEGDNMGDQGVVQQDFMIGGDISLLQKIEDFGGVYRERWVSAEEHH